MFTNLYNMVTPNHKGVSCCYFWYSWYFLYFGELTIASYIPSFAGPLCSLPSVPAAISIWPFCMLVHSDQALIKGCSADLMTALIWRGYHQRHHGSSTSPEFRSFNEHPTYTASFVGFQHTPPVYCAKTDKHLWFLQWLVVGLIIEESTWHTK